MLVVTLKENEKVLIGDKVTIQVTEIRGAQIRIGIHAPADIPIKREEVKEAHHDPK
jgi:carbon storage regulator